jgi:Replication initiation factor
MDSIVESGVDWLTLTTPEQVDVWDAEHTGPLFSVVKRAHAGYLATEREPWGWNGYAGWRDGPVSTGRRKDGSIVRVSGAAARFAAETAHLWHWRATRVDVQATVKLDGVDVDAHIAKQVKLVRAFSSGSAGKPPSVRHVQTFGQGDTLYVGSRHSEVMIRLYNKEAESGRETEYLGCVRVEMELKGRAAGLLWAQIACPSEERVSAVGVLGATALARGINSLEGLVWPDSQPVRGVPRETEDEKRLHWLEAGVAGVVKRLVLSFGTATVLDALGLTGTAAPIEGGEQDQLPLW